jgi:hypothetical protein
LHLCPRRRGFALLKPTGSAVGLFFLLLTCIIPLQAHPQVLVILADHLTLADVTRPDLPNFAQMRSQGAIALMSPGLAQKPDAGAAVYATLGAGDAVRVGDVSQGRMADTLRRAGVRTALIGNADGDDTGPYRPALLFLPSPDLVLDGTIPAPTSPGGKREDPARLWAATQTALQTCGLVVVHFGDFARAERENQQNFLLPTIYQAHRKRALEALDCYLGLVHVGFRGTVFFVVPTPPLMPDGSWNQLTPFLANGSAKEAGLARSDTTQTDGLIAARDIAPNILTALDITPPMQMTGANIAAVPFGKNVLGLLRRMDRLTRLNQEAQNPIFWAVGFGAAFLVFSALGFYLTGLVNGRAGPWVRYGLRIVSVWPLALLAAPLLNAQTVPVYFAAFVGLTCLLALLPSPEIICAITALVLVGDGLTGTRLVSNSALSEYALSGIRFYGIGNEYMGMLIAGALLLCAVPPAPNNGGVGEEPSNAFPTLTPPLLGAGGTSLLLWFALVTFVLSFPSFGAKAGGAITAMAAFVIAWRRLRGQSVTWKHLLGSVAAGFALVFIWAMLSHVLHLRRTHLETAVGALGQGRFGYILGVSLRKIGLAARVVLHPGTLLGLAAFALLWLTARRFLWRQIASYLARQPRFAAIWSAGLWGCLVAVLFNDSGIVAAILMLQCLVLSLLHRLFGEEVNATARA